MGKCFENELIFFNERMQLQYLNRKQEKGWMLLCQAALKRRGN